MDESNSPVVKKKLAPASALQWLGQKTFERAGYAWSLRRSGDLKIGMWRKSLVSSPQKKMFPKRLVFIPGFGDSPLSWLPVILLIGPALKRAGFDEIILLDFPGFNGRLVAEKCFPTMDLFLEAVSDLLDWLEPDTIFGHSLGGWLTSRYAADCGEGGRPKVKRRHGYAGPKQILLVASAGAYESVEVRDKTVQIFGDLVGEGGFNVLRPHLFAKEPLWFKWVASGFADYAADPGIRQFTESMREDQLVQNRLAHIRARTWLIWGDQDTLVPPTGIPTWLAGLTAPEAAPQAVLIRGVGHSPQLEKAGVTAAVISQILLGRTPHAKGSRWWKVWDSASVSPRDLRESVT